MSDPNAQQLGKKIKRQREELGLSLRGLARMAKIDPATLLMMEKGEYKTPDPRKLHAIARALEMPIEDLYGEVGYIAPQGLPEFAPYLRSKYSLSPASVKELDEYFAKLKARDEQQQEQKGGRRAKPRR